MADAIMDGMAQATMDGKGLLELFEKGGDRAMCALSQEELERGIRGGWHLLDEADLKIDALVELMDEKFPRKESDYYDVEGLIESVRMMRTKYYPLSAAVREALEIVVKRADSERTENAN